MKIPFLNLSAIRKLRPPMLHLLVLDILMSVLVLLSVVMGIKKALLLITATLLIAVGVFYWPFSKSGKTRWYFLKSPEQSTL
jgi:hypothetical protein